MVLQAKDGMEGLYSDNSTPERDEAAGNYA